MYACHLGYWPSGTIVWSGILVFSFKCFYILAQCECLNLFCNKVYLSVLHYPNIISSFDCSVLKDHVSCLCVHSGDLLH